MTDRNELNPVRHYSELEADEVGDRGSGVEEPELGNPEAVEPELSRFDLLDALRELRDRGRS